MGNLNKRWSVLLLVVLDIACAGGAEPCFSNSSQVLDTRVLAVRTDPPEQFVDLTGQDALAPVGISALVVRGVVQNNQQYGKAPQVTDLPTAIYVCLLPGIADINAPPGCPAGSEPVATLPNVPDLASPFLYTPPLSLLQQAVDSDPVRGLGGVQLLVELDMQNGETTLRSTTPLHYILKGSGATLNHSLVLTGIETSIAGVHTMTSDFADGIDVIVAQSTGLRPIIGPGPGGTDAVETYLAYNNAGVLTSFLEHVTYAFYDGTELFFGQPVNGNAAIYTGAPGDVADEPPPGSPDPPDGLVSMEPVFPGDQRGSFWIVARDDRGAVTWVSVPFNAVERRTNCIRVPGESDAYEHVKCPGVSVGCYGG